MAGPYPAVAGIWRALNHPLIIVLLASVLGVGRASAAPLQCVLDTAHTSVIFGVSHMGLSFTYGRFNRVDGQFVFDSENPAGCQFKVTIDAESVDTNNAKRDEHLKSADFFNTRQFPTIEFESTSVEKSADGITVTGNLNMHGETRPLTIPMQFLGEGKGQGGESRVGFLCKFVLKRSDFGMTNMIGPVGDDISVMMSFEGIAQPTQ